VRARPGSGVAAKVQLFPFQRLRFTWCACETECSSRGRSSGCWPAVATGRGQGWVCRTWRCFWNFNCRKHGGSGQEKQT